MLPPDYHQWLRRIHRRIHNDLWQLQVSQYTSLDLATKLVEVFDSPDLVWLHNDLDEENALIESQIMRQCVPRTIEVLRKSNDVLVVASMATSRTKMVSREPVLLHLNLLVKGWVMKIPTMTTRIRARKPTILILSQKVRSSM